MRRARFSALAVVLCATGLVNAQAAGNAQRGAYLVKAAGCVACHTSNEENAVAFAGGRAIVSPFGTFYGPNITPDAEHGIGRWGEADFMRAMRFGVRPDGSSYYPAFPYPSFTKMTDDDLRDLWAYLRTIPPGSRASEAHELRFPYDWRFLVTVWKRLFFTPGVFVSDPRTSATVNRGAYLVQALGHCAECHTRRNFVGALERDRLFAGGSGPDGKNIPNLTPTHLEQMSDAELKDLLQNGLTPDGDVLAESMSEVVRNTTSQLTPQDLTAVIAYLRALPPLPDAPRSAAAPQ